MNLQLTCIDYYASKPQEPASAGMQRWGGGGWPLPAKYCPLSKTRYINVKQAQTLNTAYVSNCFYSNIAVLHISVYLHSISIHTASEKNKRCNKCF